ncbi:MAG: putative bifunctional diguanylate cyclase/phosphodiesterase [Lachnospiraceae bacterium]
MKYNVDFEICAIFFLLLLIIISKARKRLENFQSKMYQIFMIVCFLNICLDVVTCYTDSYYQVVPLWLNYLLNTIFLMVQCAIPIMMCVYVYLKVQQVRESNPYILVIVALPALAAALGVLSSSLTHWFFYFDAAGYQHGVLHSWLYINAALYAIGTSIYAVYVHKYIRWSQSVLAIVMIIVILLPTIVQFFVPNYMLSGIGTSLTIFIMYLTNENSIVYLDATTGALNRQAFSYHIKLFKKKNFSEQIYVLALDNFKIINEVYGAAGGNELMRMLVEALQKEYSESSVYRLGGDKFAVVLKESAENELEKIRGVLGRKWNLRDNDIQLSACICLVHSIHYSEEHIEDAIEYSVEQAKRIGKGQYVEITEKNATEISRRAAIEQAIVSYIEKGTFEVHYQPIFDIKEGKVHSMEALARLQVPEYGYVSPEEFIRIAEKNGTILKIGLLVLEEVCQFYKEYNLEEYGIEFMEVNLSVVQCVQEHIHEDIEGIMKKYGIDFSKINLEITESAAAYSEERLIQNMKKMSQAGISFSLDDYGSGYSNINYLVDLPFSIVKIDKYLVWAAMKNETSRVILENVIAMFKKIHLKVVVEGIEDLQMVRMVTDMGADYLQGYYYSKPLTKEKIMEHLEETHG